MPTPSNVPPDAASTREKARVGRRRALVLGVSAVAAVGLPILLYLLLQTPTYTPQPDLPPSLDGHLLVRPTGGILALIILAWLAAVVSLVMDGTRLLIARRKRRSLACPNCGLREAPPTIDFGHKAIAGTGWEALACPQCHKEWHLRL
jgi:hypothetical protein